MTFLQSKRSIKAISTPQERQQPNSPSIQPEGKGPPKPFFLMDWLEEWTQDYDMHQLAALLKSPPKSDSREEDNVTSTSSSSGGEDAIEPPQTPKSSNRRCHKTLSGWASCPSFRHDPFQTRSSSISPLRPTQLNFPGRSSSGSSLDDYNNNNDQHQCNNDGLTRSPRHPKSPHSIYRKSIARGNAWNSKGLKKASEGEWLDALACWENALEIRRHLLGPNHVDVASTLNNQGIAWGKIGRYDEALESLKQALEIRTALWKSKPATSLCDCTTVLSTLHNISNVYQQAGHWEEALNVLEEARQLGHDHSAPNMPRARIAVTLGHAMCMVPDSTKSWSGNTLVQAKEALLEARRLLMEERRNQQQQLAKDPSLEEALDSAILTTQQELLDVERDLKELGVMLR